MAVSLSSRLKLFSSRPEKTANQPRIPSDAQTLSGTEMVTASGKHYVIEKEAGLFAEDIFKRACSANVEGNLELVHGIGVVTKARLESEGFCSLVSLSSHPKWRERADQVLEAINKRDVRQLLQCGASDAEVMGFYNIEELAFLDIETTGLYNVLPLFLVGVLRIIDGKAVTRQFLARSFDEELSLLEGLVDELKDCQCLVTFNGKSFDIPYINGRLIFHGIEERLRQTNIDLLKHARRLYKNDFSDCRLTTLESNLLDFKREGDVPGYLIPELYHRYVKTQDASLIKTIVEHNALDLVAMTRLLHLVGESHRAAQKTGGSVFESISNIDAV